MKRSGGSRPFRTLGSRMRAFGRSLMRHYVPPQDMPALDESSPGWQSVVETPLLWPEAPAPDVPAAAGEAEYFDAPDENIPQAAPKPRPAPARPAPAASPPQSPVQRKPAAPSKGVNPGLFDLLAKHEARESERKRIRETKLADSEAAEIQRQADPTIPPVRRRGRMAVDYVETSSLTQGDDTPPRAPKPAASEPTANTIQPERDPAQTIQRQPEADADDGAAIFEDWRDDDDNGDDNNDGGTPPAVDPTPPPLTPPGIAQRFPDESSTFIEDGGGDFDVKDAADYPQNFADVSVPPSAEPRRPGPVIQRDFQPFALDAVDDGAYDEADAPEAASDDGYEATAPETFAQPIQRDEQPAAPDAPSQTTFQQSDFYDAPLLDGESAEDGDTRPMTVQRAPILPPPSFDDENGAADETGYDSLSDWVDAHSDPATPTAPRAVQRDTQPSQSVNFDLGGDDGAGDVEDGDTRPMPVQRDYQPLPSPFEDAADFEPSFDETFHPDSPAPSSDVTPPLAANVVQRQVVPEAGHEEIFTGDSDTFEVEADDGSSFSDYSETQADDSQPEQGVDRFTWSGDANPPPANTAQRRAAPQAEYDENFVADTGDYPAPQYDENDEGGYADFDVPEQRRDETVYTDYSQPETGVQAVNASAPHYVQRQPEASYDADHFAVENTGDYEADADEYAAPNYGRPDEIADDNFYPPGQRQDEGVYTEFNAPEADNTPDFASPTNTVQRQPEATYDEVDAAEGAGEFFNEAEEYNSLVYRDEFEIDKGDYNPPEADVQAVNTPDIAVPRNTLQRQPDATYDEADAAEDAGEFAGEAEEYVAPVYDGQVEPDSSEYSAPETFAQVINTPDTAPPTQAVQRQPEASYDESYADDAGEFDVNEYAAPVDNNTPDIAPRNTVQRQPAAPETAYDEPLYGDDDAGEYVDDTGDYTYHRLEEGNTTAPDFVPTQTVQRQPEIGDDEAYIDEDDDDSSLYDRHYQAEQTEFVPAARHIDTPFSPAADPVQRAEGTSSFEMGSPTLPPQFYGDDVYETDISALLGGQPDPRPVQRRAQLPDIASETQYDMDNADTGDASVDLYQAMLQTGMVEPDVGYDSSPVEAAPPSVQRAPDDQATSQPLDLFQAMMETGMVQADREDDFYAADDAEPMSQVTRNDLLSLLDTQPPAPRAAVNQPPSVENTPAQVYQPAQPPQVVQRVETGEQPEEPEKDADVDVDQLARDVYSVLRNRLRIERERRNRNP